MVMVPSKKKKEGKEITLREWDLSRLKESPTGSGEPFQAASIAGWQSWSRRVVGQQGGGREGMRLERWVEREKNQGSQSLIRSDEDIGSKGGAFAGFSVETEYHLTYKMLTLVTDSILE